MYYDEEYARQATVTKAQALAELKKHHMTAEDIALFIRECGDHTTYRGSVVLDWLGY